MKPKTYEILTQCIEVGIKIGIARANKHEPPSEEKLQDDIYTEIVNQIHQFFCFELDDY